MQQELKYIYQVYKDGSFSKAAEHLFITQPALSIAISKIESALGMALFDRHHRPLQPTDAGMIYIETIEKMQNLENDLECQINDLKDLNTGTIKIGGSHYLNAYILPKILTGFTNQYPGIEIELVEESSYVLSNMLSERKLDFTFSCNEIFMQHFKRYAVFYDFILLAIPRDHKVNQRFPDYRLTADDIICKKHLNDNCPTLPLSEFRDLDYLLLNEGNNLYDRSMEMFQDAGFIPKIKMTISQLVTAYHLASNGFAATFISDRLVLDSSVPLTFYKIKSGHIKREFYILLPDRTYTPVATNAFIQYFLLHV